MGAGKGWLTLGGAMILLAIVARLFEGGGQGPDTPSGLRTGQTPASLAVRSLHGQPLTLRDLRGRVVVLNLWAAWCEPCRREMPALDRLRASLDPERFAVIGVSVGEDANLAREFLRGRGWAFAAHLARDPAGLRRRLGVPGLPTTLILDRKLRLRERVVGERRWDRAGIEDALRTLSEQGRWPGMPAPENRGGQGGA